MINDMDSAKKDKTDADASSVPLLIWAEDAQVAADVGNLKNIMLISNGVCPNMKQVRAMCGLQSHPSCFRSVRIGRFEPSSRKHRRKPHIALIILKILKKYLHPPFNMSEHQYPIKAFMGKGWEMKACSVKQNIMEGRMEVKGLFNFVQKNAAERNA